MIFTDQLWQSIKPIYEEILAHNFIQELATGKLELNTFIHYLQQDALYLIDYSRALAATAVKARNNQHFLICLQFAEKAAHTEISLHYDFFKQYNIKPVTEKSLACLAYTQFLLATTTQQCFAQSMAALLPCFWIYREVGKYIKSIAAPNNPYQTWIDTYSGIEFDRAVEKAIAITNEAAEHVGKAIQSQMQELFIISSKLELAFWPSSLK